MDDFLLLELVREVALLADRAHPEAVTQRAWDEARAKLGSSSSSLSPELPSSARSIARSLKRPWREVLKLAHVDLRDRGRQLGQFDAEDAASWLTSDHVAYVLKLVARRLGRRTLTAAQYEAEREAMIRMLVAAPSIRDD